MVVYSFEGSLSKPVVRKEPIAADNLMKIYNKFGVSERLSDLRICTMYAGLFRYSELSNLRMNDLMFGSEHIEITVQISKTDVYRQGNNVFIGRTCNDKCLEKY